MKRLLLVLGATLIAGSASAGLPLFAAKCPTNLNVDADRHGVVRVNGEKATVKKLNDQYYEAKHAGVTIGIGLDAGGPPSVNYTGKHGANGICEVLSYKAGRAHRRVVTVTPAPRSAPARASSTLPAIFPAPRPRGSRWASATSVWRGTVAAPPLWS